MTHDWPQIYSGKVQTMIPEHRSPLNSKPSLVVLTSLILAILAVVLICFLVGISSNAEGEGNETTLYVDDDAPQGGNGSIERPFQKIQDAVDNANVSDTIKVFNGTYHENVVVNKSLTIEGNSSADTVINGSGTGDVVLITSDWCNLSGFTIQNSGSLSPDACVKVKSEHAAIFNNTITRAFRGIYLDDSNHTLVRNNFCNESEQGIYVLRGSSNTVRNNTCTQNENSGIQTWNTVDILITGNNCTNNSYGISITTSDNVTITFNSCAGNEWSGIRHTGGNGTIANNTATMNDVHGINLEDSQNTTCENNTGSGGEYGIAVSGRDNTIRSNTFHSTMYGIRFYGQFQRIIANNFSKTEYGIYIQGSNSLIAENTLSENDYDIYVDGSWNTIHNNTCHSQNWSVFLHFQNNITVYGNTLLGGGIYMETDTLENAISIDLAQNNTLLGRTIYSYRSESGITVPTDAAQVILVNCSEFIVEDQDISNAVVGIHIIHSIDVTVRNCTLTMNNSKGIITQFSRNITIIENNCSGNKVIGIDVLDSQNCQIINNTCSNNGQSGIRLVRTMYLDLSGNTCDLNTFYGIFLSNSELNNLTQNTCSNNSDYGIYLLSSELNSVFINEANGNLDYGVKIDGDFSDENSVENNTFSMNQIGGIVVDRGSENRIINNTCDQGSRGIFIDDAAGTYIINNTCQDNELLGILLLRDVDNTRIIDNTISGAGDHGIHADAMTSASNLHLEGNIVHSNGGHGILLEFIRWSSVIRNTCYNNSDEGIRLYSSSDIDVLNNNITANLNTGLYLWKCSRVLIEENLITENDFRGIQFVETQDSEVINNTCDSNGGAGLFIGNSLDNEISNNTFSFNLIGIEVSTPSDGSFARDNLIFNNTNEGINGTKNDPFTFNATDNWWGDNSGPYHPTLNPDGTGDNVTDFVLFDPWTTEPEEPENFTTLYVATYGNDTNGTGSEDNPYLTIQKAINSTRNETTTIRVYEGTYQEEIIINATLEIIGNGTGITIIDGSLGSTDLVTITEFAEGTIIRDLDVTFSLGEGINITADNVAIVNYSITDNQMNGIRATNVSGLDIIDCYFDNNFVAGIFIDPSDTILISGTTSTMNDIGLHLMDTTGTTLVDSEFSFSNQFDLILNNSVDITSFDTTWTTVSFEDTISEIEISGSLDLTFENDTQAPVADATVIITDSEDNELFNGLTDANGTIPILNYVGQIQNQSGTFDLIPLSIEASKDTLLNMSTIETIDDHVLTLTMREYFPPEALVDHDIVFIIDEMGTIDLDATPSTGESLEYFWLFEDGSNDTNPTVLGRAYMIGGSYVINLTVTDSSENTDSLEIYVIVRNTVPYEVNIIGGNKSGDEDESLSFSGTAQDTPNDIGTGLSYVWNFGHDGEMGFGQAVDHSFPEEGNYTVNLTVVDDNGAMNFTEITVSITNKIPTPTIEVLNQEDPMSGEIVYFSAIGVSDTPSDIEAVLDYEWDFGDGNFDTGISVTHTYLESGSFTVNLTIRDDDGAEGMDTTSVNVLNLDPIADAGNDFTASVGENLTFNGSASTDPDGTIVNYTWDFDDDSIGYNMSLNHTFDSPGKYDVTLFVRDNLGDTDFVIIKVSIEAIPPVNLSIDAVSEGNEGESINFTGSAVYPGNLTFTWDFGDGGFDAGMNVTYTYADEGTFNVTLTVSTNDTDKEIYTEIEISNVKPVASFTESKTDAKIGDTISFNGGGSSDVADTELTYTWEFGDGAKAFTKTATHEYASAGDFTVKLTVNDGTENSDASTSVITITSEPPVASFTLAKNTTKTGEVVVFDATGSTGTGLTYTWDFGDNTTEVNGVVVTHTYEKVGQFTVTLLVSDGSYDREIQKSMTVEKAKKESTSEDDSGGIGIIGYVACGLVFLLLLLLLPIALYATRGDPKEINKMVAYFKEGEAMKDLKSRGTDQAGDEAVEVVDGEVVAEVEVEADEEGVVVAGVEVEEEDTETWSPELTLLIKNMKDIVKLEHFEEAIPLRNRIKEMKLKEQLDKDEEAKKRAEKAKRDAEEREAVESKKFMVNAYLTKLEKDKESLMGDIEKEESEPAKKEMERQLGNIDEKITAQQDKLKKIDEEMVILVERQKKQNAEMAGSVVGEDGVVVAGVAGEAGATPTGEALVTKPQSLVELEERRNAIDKLHPEQDNELERREGLIEAYADYEDDPDYIDYVAELRRSVKAMQGMAKKRGGAFPNTSEFSAKWNKLQTIKKKGKKGATSDDKKFKAEFEIKLAALEKMFGQPVGELLDELYEESIGELDAQIAEEEAAWEEAKEVAVAAYIEEQERKANAKADGDDKETPDGEAADGEAVEGEAVEAEAVDAEAVEAEAVEEEAVEAEGVEVEGEEVEAAEVEGVEVEGVEVEGVEIEGVEEEGVEIEGVEVEGVEIEGVEIDSAGSAGAAAGGRKKKGAARKSDQKKPQTRVTCPGCSTTLGVGTDKRPYTFSCPKCKRRITLQKEAEPAKKPEAKDSRINCPKCKSTLSVGTDARPFTFNCPKCSQRITLQAQGPGRGAPQGQMPQQPQQPGYPQQQRYDPYQQQYPGGYGGGGGQYPQAQAGGQPGTINCSQCAAPLDVSNVPRPYTFNCPRCNNRIDLR